MSKRDDFLAIATKEVGTKETPVNKVKYNDNNGQPWCGYFIMWCAKQAKFSKMPNVIWTPGGVEAFKGRGAWSNAETAAPKPGDIIFFDFVEGGAAVEHVGIVLQDNLDGTVTTIEGNTTPEKKKGSQANGGEVAIRIRAYKKGNRRKLPVYAIGFGKPKWTQG